MNKGDLVRPNQAKRICVVTSSYGPSIARLYEGLSTLKNNNGNTKYEFHPVYVRFKDVAEPAFGYPINYPYKTYDLAVTGTLESIRRIPLFMKMAKEIKKVIKHHDIGLIHAHWAIPAGFLACLVSRQIPVITTLRGSDIKKFGKRRFFQYPIKYALKHSAQIIALSNDLKTEAIQLGACENKIQVIPNGVDIAKFKPASNYKIRAELNLPDEFLILFAGDLIKLKGVDKLIKVSAKLMRALPHQLIILGDGPERARLEQLASNLESENVFFIGRVQHQDVPLYMNAVDVLVLPSESEGLPKCVQEAMACGTPVIATSVGGTPEIITDGVNGFLVNSEAELEERLRLLISNPELFSKMGANAREFATHYLSIDKVVKQTEELYQTVIKQYSLRSS